MLNVTKIKILILEVQRLKNLIFVEQLFLSCRLIYYMHQPSSRTYSPSLKAGIKTVGKTKFKTNLSDLLDFGEFHIH